MSQAHSMIQFPCLKMSNDYWIMSDDDCSRPSSPHEEGVASNNSKPHSKWLYEQSSSSDENIMAPVLTDRGWSFWLADRDSNDSGDNEYRAPVSDRVPNPNTSLWLAASTTSIRSQDNIEWPSGLKISPTTDNDFSPDCSKSMWLSASGRMDCASPRLLPTSLSSSDLSRFMPAKAGGPISGDLDAFDLDRWLHRGAADGVRAWLEQEEEEDLADGVSSIVVLDEDHDDDEVIDVDDDLDVDQDGDEKNYLDFWLI